jgi:IS4 transposase
MRKIQMEQANTFSKYLDPIFVNHVFALIKELQLDRYVKKLDILKFLQLFIYAQLNQTKSLRDISLALNENEFLQNVIGLPSISASQLSRTLRKTGPDIFIFIFKCCIDHIKQKYGNKVCKRPEVSKLMCLIDSSVITLCISKYPWAKFKSTKAGVKIHVSLVYADDITAVEDALITNAVNSDGSQMDELISIDKDCLNVFDRGYMNYKKFDEMCEKGDRFVTRLKSNSSYEVIEELPVPEDSKVTRMAKIRLGSKSTYLMKNHLYLIETTDSQGNALRIITNDRNLDADEVSEAYKNRWQIELFFKWIKQHLNVKHIYGTSQNALFNQIYIALITHCLLVVLQLDLDQDKKIPLLQIYKYLKLHLVNPFNQFLEALFRKSSITSKGRRRSSPIDKIFEETQWQYENGRFYHYHLDLMDYDPVHL